MKAYLGNAFGVGRFKVKVAVTKNIKMFPLYYFSEF